MDIRSKLKLFNDEILVSSSCVDTDGNTVFGRWIFDTYCGNACYFAASQEWVEKCASISRMGGSCIAIEGCASSVLFRDGDIKIESKDISILSQTYPELSISCSDATPNEKSIVPKSYIDEAIDNINGFSYTDEYGYGVVRTFSVDGTGSGISFPGAGSIFDNSDYFYIRGGHIYVYGCCTATIIGNKGVTIETENGDNNGIVLSPNKGGNDGIGGTVHVCGNLNVSNCISTPNITVDCTSVFTCDSTFGDDATVTFGCSPYLKNKTNISDDQLVPKSYVDNATATKFSCTYTDLEEHTISVGSYSGIYFSPEEVHIKGCGGNLQIYSSNSGLDVSVNNISLSRIPYASNAGLCLTDGFGDEYLATEAYVNAKINGKHEVLSIGCEAWTVDIKSETYDSISFNETKLPTTGGTVATQSYVEESMKSLPYTCIYHLGECTPVNGIVSWEITLMCGDQRVMSVIPPHVSILKNDSSTMFGGTYVNADVSVYISDVVGSPNETRVKIEMNATETIPACTFKAVVSNIYARCLS